MGNKTIPESQEADFLTSSNTLPEFAELDIEWAGKMSAAKEQQESEMGARKRGNKKDISKTLNQAGYGTAPLEPEGLTFDAKEIESWVCMPFDFLFNQKGMKPLNNIERIAWSQNCAAMLNKYAPAASKWKEETGFIICLASIVLARKEAPKPKKKPEEKKPDNKKVIPLTSNETKEETKKK